MGRKGKTRKRRKGKKKPSQAARADRYTLYERSVQEPEADIEFAVDAFREEFGRRPRRLREDFCGTAALCRDWVRAHKRNTAVGVDLDPVPLRWGLRKNIEPLPSGARKRVQLLRGDVRTTQTDPADVVMALNFSYFLFKERPALVRYLQSAREHLDDEGIVVLDAYGGPDSVQRMTEETEYDDFSYIWDQDDFDPIGRMATCYIHFEFPDGSKIRRAFQYYWRMYTIPEIREALLDAGFSAAHAYWEGTDPETEEGDGTYERRDRAEPDDAWVVYIVGVKR